MKRALLLLAAAASLGGCNLVYSETPLFSAADARGAPQLRPGVWAEREEGCDFDSAKPVGEWPECAGGSVISPTQLTTTGEKPSSTAYVLTGGDPQVMQFALEMEPTKPLIYLYGGLRALKRDDRGRIVEAETWIAQCGPPPPKPVEAPDEQLAEAASLDQPSDETPAEESGFDEQAATAEHAEHWSDAPADEGEAMTPPDQVDAPPADGDAFDKEVEKAVAAGVTREPLPGLEIKDGMCVAREQGPVRNAVAESRAYDTPSVMYWVRDGDR